MADDDTKKSGFDACDAGDDDESPQQPQQPSSSSRLLLPHRVDESVLEPFRYISGVPGKDVRGKLVDCFQLWFRVDESEGDDAAGEGEGGGGACKKAAKASTLDKIKEIVANLHNASLLVDDIEDNSQLRRGVPVAHKIFGIPSTINCANYVYFLALERCHALRNDEAMRVFVGELLNLHRGQGQDIAWRDSGHCPTESEYLAMVVDKTGGLFRLAVGLLQAFASPSSKYKRADFTSLVNNLAMYFQIRDDYINLADEEYMKSKSFCEDLTEGKFSYPIIHCIRSSSSTSTSGGGAGDTRLLNILKQRTDDVEVKRYAQNLMKESGSLRYTRRKCSQLKEEIVRDVEGFGGNPPLLKLIRTLDVQLEQIASTTADGDDADIENKKDGTGEDESIVGGTGGDANSKQQPATPVRHKQQQQREKLDIDEA